MKILPAIDIKDKKCVRLIKGDFHNKINILKKFDEALGQRQLTDYRLLDMRYSKQLVAREWI